MTTNRINPTEFAILGLLAEQSRSGYDIKKEVETRLSHFWSESYGHIYPMLRRLQKRQLVAVRRVKRQRGKPERNVYSLTETGRRALEAWFEEPATQARPRNELLLRVFFGRHAPVEALVRDVGAYHASVSAALGQLRQTEADIDAASASPDAPYWKLVVTFGVRLFEVLEEWSATAEAQLRDEKQAPRGKARRPAPR